MGSALAATTTVLPLLAPDKLPSSSASNATTATLVLANQRKREIAIDWIDFRGARKRYLVLRPGGTHVQTTFAGHVWLFSEDGAPLGGVVATAGEARVDVR